jgi:hypothetical protein
MEINKIQRVNLWISLYYFVMATRNQRPLVSTGNYLQAFHFTILPIFTQDEGVPEELGSPLMSNVLHALFVPTQELS